MTKEEIIDIILKNKKILKKYKVKFISLFGSYVRNEQKEDSDVDLLVEFKEPTYHNFINLVFSLEILLKKEVNLIPEGSLSPYLEPYIRKEALKISFQNSKGKLKIF